MKIKKLIPTMMMAACCAVSCQESGLKSGLDANNLDQTVKPVDDFYQFACGGWMKSHPLPAIYSRYGSFDKLGEDNEKRLHEILSDLEKKEFEEGSVEKKLSDLFKLAMDSVSRDKEGIAPVKAELERIEAAKTNADLFEILKSNLKYGDQQFIAWGFTADEKNSSENILTIFQSGTILPERSYYLEDSEEMEKIRDAYKKHIVRMFKLFGFDEAAAEKKMNSVMTLETKLAEVQKSQQELRDVHARYNKMTFEEFSKKYPNLKLGEQLQTLGINPDFYKEMVVGQPSFVEAVNKMIAKLPTEDYRAYMEWGLIQGSASYLSQDVYAANFEFFGKALSGINEMRPLWKRATAQVEGVMGEALGKMYVERFFPASSKERMTQLVKNLQTSLAERIKAQSWMSDSTKAAAIDKLDNFYVKIGYPDEWKDMSALTIDPSKSYYDNIMACNQFWTKWVLDHKAGQKVDKTQWQMNPQEVNAYYDPTTNEICFPAGILQKPFFDPEADDAFNYGAIGVVIGHEMTHGFDDMGRNFDKKGDMVNWWTDEDAQKFNALADKLVAQFDSIVVLGDQHANGRLTLGENIADQGGLRIAYSAYMKTKEAQENKTVDGLTPAQRFYLSYAHVWADNIRDAEILRRTTMDEHSLGRWRVNATLKNIDTFYDAFDIQEGDAMYLAPEDRVVIW